MGTASGVGFTSTMPMADGGGSVGSARARGEQPGRVYMGAGGRLGGRGVNHVADARTAWAARCCDVRRRGGQWRAAARRPMACGGWHAGEWKLATWRRPNARGHHPQWHAGTAHGPLVPPGASACARGARMAADVARVRDVACGRALEFPGCLHFTEQFSKLFFSNFSN
jgi:hypothetical protein